MEINDFGLVGVIVQIAPDESQLEYYVDPQDGSHAMLTNITQMKRESDGAVPSFLHMVRDLIRTSGPVEASEANRKSWPRWPRGQSRPVNPTVISMKILASVASRPAEANEASRISMKILGFWALRPKIPARPTQNFDENHLKVHLVTQRWFSNFENKELERKSYFFQSKKKAEMCVWGLKLP